MFHQSGGCCDGSSPMCYPEGEFIVGDRDVLLGVLCGAPVWISGTQFDTWKHTQLIIDVVPGRGGGFSLEAPEGVRFLSRGRVFTPAELETLAVHPPFTGADYEQGLRPPPRDGVVVDDDAERQRGGGVGPSGGVGAPDDACQIPGRHADAGPR